MIKGKRIAVVMPAYNAEHTSENSHYFVFHNEMLAKNAVFGNRIGEILCPTKYFKEASSISFRRTVPYGLGVLLIARSHYGTELIDRIAIRRCLSGVTGPHAL
jgi:hypothetical protein